MKKRRFLYLVCLLLVTGSVTGAFALRSLFPGLHVNVANKGPAVMRAVKVHVTGKSYLLGDLAAGDSSSVRISPRSESHVEIEFINEKGQRVRLNAGGYFEPGYQANIEIAFRKDEIVRFDYKEVGIDGY